MHFAFEYILENNGIQLASSYPYVAREQETCQMDLNKNVKNLMYGYQKLDENDNDAMKKAVSNQVLASAVDATNLGLYNGGVFNLKNCSSDINHAIAIVGYGIHTDGRKYWKIRNSWGKDWGMKGHILLLRHEGKKKGLCGITEYNLYPKY